MLATHKSTKTPWHAAGSGIAIASLLLLMVPGRRRLGGLLVVVLSVGLIGGTIGCSSSQSAPPTTTSNSNPYAGTYTVTVTGSYTGTNNQVTQHAVVVTYNIN
jgi:hypothetical protein